MPRREREPPRTTATTLIEQAAAADDLTLEGIGVALGRAALQALATGRQFDFLGAGTFMDGLASLRKASPAGGEVDPVLQEFMKHGPGGSSQPGPVVATPPGGAGHAHPGGSGAAPVPGDQARPDAEPDRGRAAPGATARGAGRRRRKRDDG